MTPLGALGRGLIAGIAGTAAMTAYQELLSKNGGSKEPTWEDAPAPAQVARRILKSPFDEDVSTEKIPLLTNLMHWAYGTAWAGVYGLVQDTARASPLLTVEKDLSYHLVYGLGVAAAFETLE